MGSPGHIFDFSLAGLVVGIFVGLSGVGGSALLAPILILLLGVKPSIAIGTDLLYSVPTKILALVLLARQKAVDWKLTRILLAGGAPGALAGLGVYALLRRHFEPELLQMVLRHAIGAAILVAAAGAAGLWLTRSRDDVRPASNFRRPGSSAMTAGIGLLVGFLVAITSVGSGSITLPLLILVFPGVALRNLIGSEIAFAAFLIPLAATGYVASGDVGWTMVAALLVGSLPGVWIGNVLSRHLSESWIRPIALGILAFAGSRLA